MYTDILRIRYRYQLHFLILRSQHHWLPQRPLGQCLTQKSLCKGDSKNMMMKIRCLQRVVHDQTPNIELQVTCMVFNRLRSGRQKAMTSQMPAILVFKWDAVMRNYLKRRSTDGAKTYCAFLTVR